MSKVVFDTNIYVYACEGYPPAQEFIEQYIKDGAKIILPVTIKGELLSIPRRDRDLAYREKIDGLISLADELVVINDAIASLSGEIRRWLYGNRNKKKLPFADATIAATAKHVDATLISHNDKDFKGMIEEFKLSYFSPFDKKDFQKFFNVKVPRIGMRPQEVKESTWGEPKHTKRTTTGTITYEHWTYSNLRYILFQNGVVTHIRERK